MAPPEAKASPGGVHMEHAQVYSAGGASPAAPAAVLNYVLRFAALALTPVAAIVFGTAKKTVTVFDENGNPADLLSVKAIAASAGKYFVAANVIVAAYSTASLVLSVVSRGASRSMALVLTLLDVVIVAFLFSANGAGSAIAVIAKKGEGLLWPKICDGAAGKVCDGMTAGIVLSMFAALAYVVLVFVSVLAIHKRAQAQY